MYSTMFFSFVYFLIFSAGVIFFICLIVFMFQYLSLKKEQNQLLREGIQALKEKIRNEN